MFSDIDILISRIEAAQRSQSSFEKGELWMLLEACKEALKRTESQ